MDGHTLKISVLFLFPFDLSEFKQSNTALCEGYRVPHVGRVSPSKRCLFPHGGTNQWTLLATTWPVCVSHALEITDRSPCALWELASLQRFLPKLTELISLRSELYGGADSNPRLAHQFVQWLLGQGVAGDRSRLAVARLFDLSL